MCLSHSQPLDHINTFDLRGERERERRGKMRRGMTEKETNGSRTGGGGTVPT